MKRVLPLLLALAGLATSCRSLILEDRMVCPSFLFFDIDNPGPLESYNRVRIASFSYPETNLTLADTTVLRRIQDKDYYMKVPKADAVQGFGVAGFDGALVRNGSEVVVEPGENYVPLFRFSYRTPALEEKVLIPVELFKDYCRITLQFTRSDAFSCAQGLFPFYLVVSGNTVGIDGLSGLPVRGSFRYTPEEEQEGRFQVLVPRQADRTLQIEIWAKEGQYIEEGLLDTYNLWQLIQTDDRFSWDARNLPDLYILLDYTENKVEITVEPWIKEGSLSYDI